MTPTGYLHPSYAASLEYGEPRRLAASGGWLIQREIGATGARDAISCYPLLCCADWNRLEEDVRQLKDLEDLVTVTVVTDPFGETSAEQLQRCFPDLARPFKEHFVVDLSRPAESVWDPHHRRNVRKGLQAVQVERVGQSVSCAAEWVALYTVLSARHGITGFAAFSPRALTAQLGVPGAVVFRASRDGQAAGMTVWYVQNDVAYYHLGAYTDDGYRQYASFALFAEAIQYFTSLGLKWLDLGAGAGLADDPSGGLARFKRGWSTGTRTAYLCGRVLDRARYSELVKLAGAEGDPYFPAYRNGTFALR